jgi:undecaprenyl-diphosphatase
MISLYKKKTYVYLAAASLFAFLLTTLLVVTNSSHLLNVNEMVYLYLNEPDLGSLWYSMWRFVTAFGGVAVLSFLTVVVALYSYVGDGHKKEAVLYFLSMLVGAVSVILLKEVISTDRPLSLYGVEETFAYPSGHAALATVFSSVSGYFLLRDRKTKRHFVVLFLVVIYVFFVCLSRLVLKEHWVFDVFGGVFLGIFLAASAILIFEELGVTSKLENKSPNTKH